MALNVTAAGVTMFTTAPLGGGSVYNFTTINIAAGSTLKLSGSVFPGPLYFLAQGAVTVAGTIDLSGQSGAAVTISAQLPTIPGSGGYGGGAGSWGNNSAQPGYGPAGGATSGSGCNINAPKPGGFTGNQFLVPLVGGSGGGGGTAQSGGAGGGALLHCEFSIDNRNWNYNGGRRGWTHYGGQLLGRWCRRRDSPGRSDYRGYRTLTAAGGTSNCEGSANGTVRVGILSKARSPAPSQQRKYPWQPPSAYSSPCRPPNPRSWLQASAGSLCHRAQRGALPSPTSP